MIIIAEPTCIGSEHAPFNAAVVEIARILNSESELVFYGEQSHIEAVKLVLGDRVPTNITWKTIYPPPRFLRKFFKRFVLESLIFRKILTSNKTCDLLIVTSAVDSSLSALKTQCYMTRFKPRINVIFHAGLPQFLYSKKRQKLLSAATPENMTYIVLGEYIKNNVAKQIPEISKKIFGIEHPYIFENKTHPKTLPNNKPIFGFIGLASKAKGFDKYLTIIDQHSKNTDFEGPKRFRLVGCVADDCAGVFENFTNSNSEKFLDYPKTRQILPLDVYRDQIRSVDYFIMPYDIKTYEFICSGAAMDAIYFGKPIIALKSPYFTYLFDLCGDIGYLCTDLNQITLTIGEINKGADINRYKIQQSNLVLAREKFSPKTISKQLEEINRTQ